MTINYVKHDREVTTDQLQRYGKFATHDIHVPVLLAYERGLTPDKNGTVTDVNEKFLQNTLKATNSWIKERYNSPFAKLKSFWSKPLENVEVIPIIKNHNTGEVDDIVGHLRGLLRIEDINGIKSLMGDATIKDPEAKEKISGDLFRATSLGTRSDGSIKEVSFVINEAMPHGGLLMSESTQKTKNIDPILEKSKELQLSEQIHGLQLAEHELDNVIIPNHLRMAKLIKTGRLMPWKYDKLINNPNADAALQLMEGAAPSINLGIIYGTKIQPKGMDAAELLVNNITAKYKTNTEKSKIEIKQEVDMINRPMQLEEQRTNELKHLLELSEHSPEILIKYLKIELGEQQSTDDCELKDTLLTEYMAKSKDIKQKLKSLQFGEQL